MFTKPNSHAADVERAVSMLRAALKSIYIEHGEIGTCSRAAVPLFHLARAIEHLPHDIANGHGRRCKTCPYRDADVVRQPLDDQAPNRLEPVCTLPRNEVDKCPIVRAVGYTTDWLDSLPGYLKRQAN